MTFTGIITGKSSCNSNKKEKYDEKGKIKKETQYRKPLNYERDNFNIVGWFSSFG